MADHTPFRISVRDLVDITLKSGSLSRMYVSRERAAEGIHGHRQIQESRPDTFLREVPVSLTVSRHGIDLDVHGRVDGVDLAGGNMTVEEIKTCVQDPAIPAASPKESHLSQLKCYGYMILKTRHLDRARLKLTYANVRTGLSCAHEWETDIRTLEPFFMDLAYRYIDILSRQSSWEKQRNRSIMDMPFAYDDFRPSQRELSVAVYQAVKHERILFASAPTGTGKTIATLFPAIKSMGLNQTGRIFYLTAKTIGRTVVQKALDDMRQKGLRVRSIALTAKQKICVTSDESCDMDHCPYAANYYGKLHHALEDALESDTFDRTFITELAGKHMICPFELSLDLCLSCDVIICDLNYAFDPRVHLKRFFDNSRARFTFLIDEAHNLPDRLRSMYSATLAQSRIIEAGESMGQHAPGLAGRLSAVDTLMSGMRMQCEKAPDRFMSTGELPREFMTRLEEFAADADAWLDTHSNSPVKETVTGIYFEITGFLVIADHFDDHYRLTMEQTGPDLLIKLFCIDPSAIFSRLIRRSRSAVFFSATLYPMDYYQSLLFTPDIPVSHIAISSSFPKDRLLPVIVDSIRTTYRERDRSLDQLARIIHETVCARPGNYLVFFPSYAYMEKTAHRAEDRFGMDGLLIQTPGMSEPQKEDYLNRFTDSSRTVGFAVMGGIFGEGIDLKKERLVGVIIVGVGTPQVSCEQNLIKTYYDHTFGNGFFYAFQMPGFCRVMQAAGRLIRTESDKGAAIFIDQRFSRRDYQSLFPEEYRHAVTVSSVEGLVSRLARFWET